MSRIIDNNSANYLYQAGYDLAENAQEFTNASFVKLIAFDGTLFGLSGGNGIQQQRVENNYAGSLKLNITP